MIRSKDSLSLLPFSSRPQVFQYPVLRTVLLYCARVDEREGETGRKQDTMCLADLLTHRLLALTHTQRPTDADFRF